MIEGACFSAISTMRRKFLNYVESYHDCYTVCLISFRQYRARYRICLTVMDSLGFDEMNFEGKKSTTKMSSYSFLYFPQEYSSLSLI